MTGQDHGADRRTRTNRDQGAIEFFEKRKVDGVRRWTVHGDGCDTVPFVDRDLILGHSNRLHRLGIVMRPEGDKAVARARLSPSMPYVSSHMKYLQRKCGAITHHSASVGSVWYRVTMRLCCYLLVGVPWRIQGWFKKPVGITAGAWLNLFSKTTADKSPGGLNLDIDGWLRGIGLEQYAQTLRDNAIDADVLRDLTDEHLRELGLPLGARLKLLRAVAGLGTSEQPPASPEVTPPAPRTDAERRQVTVMFSDLVGSTALSARMDPEDLREVISAYQQSVAETVRRFGGFVAKYMGDGVLIYFGYPQAHEDDAERAVRAGLELVAAVTSLKTRASLQTRVGIATGLVVVGDLIGSGSAQEQASSARRRTLRHACKVLRRRTASSSPKARVGYLAICLSLKTSEQMTSRVSRSRCGPGQRCDQLRWKAALRLSTRAA